MVVRRYFYLHIDPIARQVAALRMMELTAKFSQEFTTIACKASFIFLPSDIQLILKNIWNYLAMWTSSFQVKSVKDFQRLDLEKA
jgi:hypothetical protein